jgi:hypothetical protein
MGLVVAAFYTSFQAGPAGTDLGATFDWKPAENRRNLTYYIFVCNLSATKRTALRRSYLAPEFLSIGMSGPPRQALLGGVLLGGASVG